MNGLFQTALPQSLIETLASPRKQEASESLETWQHDIDDFLSHLAPFRGQLDQMQEDVMHFAVPQFEKQESLEEDSRDFQKSLHFQSLLVNLFLGNYQNAQTHLSFLAINESDPIHICAAFLFELEVLPKAGWLPEISIAEEKLAQFRTCGMDQEFFDVFVKQADSVIRGYEAIEAQNWNAFSNAMSSATLEKNAFGLSLEMRVLQTHIIKCYFIKYLLNHEVDKMVEMGNLLIPASTIQKDSSMLIPFVQGRQNEFYYYWLGRKYEESSEINKARNCYKPFYDHGLETFQSFNMDQPDNPMKRYLRLSGQLDEAFVITMDLTLLKSKDKDIERLFQEYTDKRTHFSQALPIWEESENVTITKRKDPVTLDELLGYLSHTLETRRLSKKISIRKDEYGKVLGGGLPEGKECLYIEPNKRAKEYDSLKGQNFLVVFNQHGLRCDITLYWVFKYPINTVQAASSFNEMAHKHFVALKTETDRESANLRDLIKSIVFNGLAKLAELRTPYGQDQEASFGGKTEPYETINSQMQPEYAEDEIDLDLEEDGAYFRTPQPESGSASMDEADDIDLDEI